MERCMPIRIPLWNYKHASNRRVGKQRIILTISFGITLLYFIYLLRIRLISYCTHSEVPGNKLNPPQLTKKEKQILLNLLMQNDKEKLEKVVSEIIKNQIKTIQSKDCKAGTILCGHHDDCGFGCQVHHRVACLMLSYAMGLPLIHDETTSWPYESHWREMFLPLGADCSPGPNTYNWTWLHNYEFYTNSSNMDLQWNHSNYSNTNSSDLQYPFVDGIVASTEMIEFVEYFHSIPFQWWISQFVNYALRIKPNIKQRIQEDKDDIGFTSKCIGIHIRRTDKVNEARDSFHEIEDYFNASVEAFSTKLLNETKKLDRFNLGKETLPVFIASDDSQVLTQAQNKSRFPQWNVIGYNSNITLRNPKERKNFFYEIIRDLMTLADCEYIICGLTSNVCRLVREMFSYKYMDPEPRFHSLDGSYSYVLWAHTMEEKLRPVNTSNEHCLV